MRLTLSSWAAWAPGLEEPDAWSRWAAAPWPLAAEGVPNARFLAPMLRRRCTPLSKMMLRAAFDCAGEGLRSGVRTVFASRHGSINESLDLLRCVVRDEPMSPARFSHTVHNAQAGLFSIASENRQASSSLAAQEDTFACGFLEACGHLEREPGRPVLLVTGDAPLDPTFAPMVAAPQVPYAVALLLESAGDGGALDFAIAPAGSAGAGAPLEWPDALEFVRWWVGAGGGDDALVLPGLRSGFRWSRPRA